MHLDPLPPPPRPHLVKAFYYAVSDVLYEEESSDNDSPGKRPRN